MHEVVWWDEHHRKVRLGCASKLEVRIARDERGTPTAPADGGVFPPRKPVTTVKFPGEARGAFGVAMRKKADNPEAMEGIRCAPFFYTGKKIVGLNEYQLVRDAEQASVRTKKGQWGKEGAGYKERYGDEWEAALDKKCQSSLKTVPITVLIDHIIEESKKVYAGTEAEDRFLIYHDGLSQLWEKGAVDYLKKIGWHSRFIRCWGDTNAGTRYFEKVPGDSPELCRGLDSHGFADLKGAIEYHVSLTSAYEVGDPRKFGFGTPAEVQHTMERVWQVAPTSERIVEDISCFHEVVKKIIEAQGCVVPDEFLRTGRRARRADDKGVCKVKPRKRQRKETNQKIQDVHPDAVEARATFTSASLWAQG